MAQATAIPAIAPVLMPDASPLVIAVGEDCEVVVEFDPGMNPIVGVTVLSVLVELVVKGVRTAVEDELNPVEDETDSVEDELDSVEDKLDAVVVAGGPATATVGAVSIVTVTGTPWSLLYPTIMEVRVCDVCPSGTVIVVDVHDTVGVEAMPAILDGVVPQTGEIDYHKR